MPAFSSGLIEIFHFARCDHLRRPRIRAASSGICQQAEPQQSTVRQIVIRKNSRPVEVEYSATESDFECDGQRDPERTDPQQLPAGLRPDPACEAKGDDEDERGADQDADAPSLEITDGWCEMHRPQRAMHRFGEDDDEPDEQGAKPWHGERSSRALR